MMKEKKLSWEELEAKAIYTPEKEDEEIEETNDNKKTKISLKPRQSTPKIHTKKEQKQKGTTKESEQKSESEQKPEPEQKPEQKFSEPERKQVQTGTSGLT